jgi:hypothetical protein
MTSTFCRSSLYFTNLQEALRSRGLSVSYLSFFIQVTEYWTHKVHPRTHSTQRFLFAVTTIKLLSLSNVNFLRVLSTTWFLIYAECFTSLVSSTVATRNTEREYVLQTLCYKLIRVQTVHSKLILIYVRCPTRYRTRHFFNKFTTNEDIATKFEAHYRHIALHFSHNERTPVQISLQYLH